MTGQEAWQMIRRMERDFQERLPRLEKLSDWICPWRGRLPGRESERDGRHPERFTSISADALLRGASGMTSGMTPRSISWFKPSFHTPGMEELTGARGWLDNVDKRMKETLAMGGFYQAIQNFNLDLLWCGAGLLYSESEGGGLNFYCIQPGAYHVLTDTAGNLEAVARRLTLSVKECATRFGEAALSEKARGMLGKNPFARMIVWHLCLPLDEPDGGFTCRSYFLEENAKAFLRRGGFYEMPYFFAVWNEGRTPYGTGPGDAILADALQMDMLERHKLAGLGKLVDPPMIAPPDMKDTLDLSPGAINFSTASQQVRPVFDLSPFAQGLSALQNEIATVAGRIEKGLMAQVFSSMPLDQRPAGMSATEFLERKREALQQLGPIMSAYEPRVLSPLLFRVAFHLEREGLLPDKPESLARYSELFMQMDFISPMANALRQTGAETTRALVQDMAALVQATGRQEVLDKLDLDQIVDELAQGLGAPGNITRSDEDTQKIREQSQARQQQQQALQAMGQGAAQPALDAMAAIGGGMG